MQERWVSLRRTVRQDYEMHFRDVLKMLIDSEAHELWEELNEKPTTQDENMLYLNPVHSVFE